MQVARDARPARPPFATYALIAASTALFVYQVSLGTRAEAFLQRWGLTPAHVAPVAVIGGHPFALVTLVTATFLHAGALHLLSNMLYLYVFGTRVEPRLGWRRFVALYVVSGAVGALTLAGMTRGSDALAVGASGAVAGVLGAYLYLFPYAPLALFAPRALRLEPDVVAAGLLGLWLLAQLLGGLATLGYGTMFPADASWWAHSGGFLAGLALAAVFVTPMRAPAWRMPRWPRERWRTNLRRGGA